MEAGRESGFFYVHLLSVILLYDKMSGNKSPLNSYLSKKNGEYDQEKHRMFCS